MDDYMLGSPVALAVGESQRTALGMVVGKLPTVISVLTIILPIIAEPRRLSSTALERGCVGCRLLYNLPGPDLISPAALV